MSSWLIWTGLAEILNIAIFSLLAWVLVAGRPGTWHFTWIGVATLDVVLLEGGLYWLFKRLRIGSLIGPGLRLDLLNLLYAANGVLVLVFPFAVVAGQYWQLAVNLPDLLLGSAYYLFAWGEFVHYFVVKINMRPWERHLAGQRGQRVPARFRRELARASAEASRGR